MLGPSLFGHYFPRVFMTLFARQSVAPLETLSTIGIVLLLFIIGTEVGLEMLSTVTAPELWSPAA